MYLNGDPDDGKQKDEPKQEEPKKDSGGSNTGKQVIVYTGQWCMQQLSIQW